MRVTLSAPVVQRLQESFEDFSNSSVNEILSVLIAERNILKDCLHSGQHAAPVVSISSPDISQFSGILDD